MKETTTTSRRSARIASSSGPAAAAPPKAERKTKPKAEPKATKSASKKEEPKDEAKPKRSFKKAAAEEAAAEAPPQKTSRATKTAIATDDKKEVKTNGDKPPSSARGVLKLGQTLPKLTLQDNSGEDVDIASLAGERGIVLFLYPRADTPGCTSQAMLFSSLKDDIAAFGYDIYGMSKDTPAAQQKWITKKQLNFKLLCDPELKLIKKLGAFVLPKNVKRSHFIFEKGTGKLVDIALSVKPADDAKNVVKFLKAHHA